MKNKVQLKTGDKIKIPTRKTSGMSINGFLEEYKEYFENQNYLIIGTCDIAGTYNVARVGSNEKFGAFKLEDFDPYEEPIKFKEGDKVAVPTQKTFCNPYTLEHVFYSDESKQMIKDGFGIVKFIGTDMRNGKETIDVRTSNNQFVGTFYTEDLVPYKKTPEVDKLYSQMQRKMIVWDSGPAAKETEFEVGDIVEIPTTKNAGYTKIEECCHLLHAATYGKIKCIIRNKYTVAFYNLKDKFLGEAYFTKEDLVLRPLTPKKLSSLEKAANFGKAYGAPAKQVSKVHPNNSNLPGVGGTSFDIVLDEYPVLNVPVQSINQPVTTRDILDTFKDYPGFDVFLAARGYGKDLLVTAEKFNKLYQKEVNNKNALTILALRS